MPGVLCQLQPCRQLLSCPRMGAGDSEATNTESPGVEKEGWGHPPSTPCERLGSPGTALGTLQGYLGHEPSCCF